MVSPRIRRGEGLAGLDDPFLGPLDLGWNDVAKGLDLNAVDVEEILNVGRAHAPHADEADADAGKRSGGESGPAFARNPALIAEKRLETGQDSAHAGGPGGGGFQKITAVLNAGAGGIVFHVILLAGIRPADGRE
jgi:hypothetical protein